MNALERLIKKYPDITMLEMAEKILRYESAIRWALGYTSFRARKDNEGPYWWRTELRKRAKPEGD